eukprot:717796-Hanusia_phi.AAC.4
MRKEKVRVHGKGRRTDETSSEVVSGKGGGNDNGVQRCEQAGSGRIGAKTGGLGSELEAGMEREREGGRDSEGRDGGGIVEGGR